MSSYYLMTKQHHDCCSLILLVFGSGEHNDGVIMVAVCFLCYNCFNIDGEESAFEDNEALA